MCSICIDEFEDGEKIRLLPMCGHAFHTECILPWLTQRQGCRPYCRTAVVMVSEVSDDDHDGTNHVRIDDIDSNNVDYNNNGNNGNNGSSSIVWSMVTTSTTVVTVTRLTTNTVTATTTTRSNSILEEQDDTN